MLAPLWYARCPGLGGRPGWGDNGPPWPASGVGLNAGVFPLEENEKDKLFFVFQNYF